MRLGSMEYMEKVKEISNSDEKYQQLAKGQNESYTLVLQAEPDKGVTKQVVVGFDCKDGAFVEIWEGQRPTMFTLSAPYGVWVDILRGKLGATKAITIQVLWAIWTGPAFLVVFRNIQKRLDAASNAIYARKGKLS